MVHFWVLSFVLFFPLTHVSAFMMAPHCFGYDSLKSDTVMPPVLFLWFTIALWFHMKLSVVSSVKGVHGILNALSRREPYCCCMACRGLRASARQLRLLCKQQVA